MSTHLSQVPLLLILAACCGLLAPAAGQNTYGCASSGVSQRRLTNFGKFTFVMAPLSPNASYLQPNMDCSITIIGYSTSRWIIAIDYISLSAYQAELNIYEGETTSGKSVISLTSSSTDYRQFGVSTGSFTVRQTTKSGPAGIALGIRMTVEHLETTQCPSNWYSVSSSAGYCYGVPKLAGNLTYDQSAKACNMMLANLVMGNFDYDSISSELLTAPVSVVNPRLAYWVGMYMFDKDSDVKFLNKYTSLDSVSGRLCSISSTSCQCIAYQGGRFYKDDCSSQRQYICYMPRGGTSSYYDIDSLVAATSTVITIIAIVLTVGFILAVLISLIVVLVCCIRRKSAARQSRCRNTNAGAFVIGGANQSLPYPTNPIPSPPPPPPAAPPYTISAPPQYTTIYSNFGFDASGASAAAQGGTEPANFEKPPAYNPEWSEHRVPA